MKKYFVVFQLPKSKKHSFIECIDTPEVFWKDAAAAVRSGKLKIISKRADTGISEELREHVEKSGNYRSYILVNMELGVGDKKSAIFKKLTETFVHEEKAEIIEANNNFQLVTFEV